MADQLKTEKFDITGMTCASCQANVTRGVQKHPGVREVNVSLLANQMSVTYDENVVGEADIVHAVENIGYGASPQEGHRIGKGTSAGNGGGGPSAPRRSGRE